MTKINKSTHLAKQYFKENIFPSLIGLPDAAFCTHFGKAPVSLRWVHPDRQFDSNRVTLSLHHSIEQEDKMG